MIYKKKHHFKLLFIIPFFLLTSCSFNKTASEIYKESVNYVVEVKSVIGSECAYGSGVIIKDNETIITNAHMVTIKENNEYKTFDSFYIRFATSNDYIPVELFKYDIELDLAFLKPKENIELKYSVTLGNSDNLQVGETCYAIGNAMNQGISLTEGIISLSKVDIEYNSYVRRVIQCDLTINEGNSGGALLNSKGELIGIVSFRLKDIYGNIIYGIAYSIPINIVISFIEK